MQMVLLLLLLLLGMMQLLLLLLLLQQQLLINVLLLLVVVLHRLLTARLLVMVVMQLLLVLLLQCDGCRFLMRTADFARRPERCWCWICNQNAKVIRLIKRSFCLQPIMQYKPFLPCGVSARCRKG